MKKFCYICKERFSTNGNNKKYYKVRDHCDYSGKYRRPVYDICSLRNKTPKEIPLLLSNGSTSDCHFIIKDIAEEFESRFECLGGFI